MAAKYAGGLWAAKVMDEDVDHYPNWKLHLFLAATLGSIAIFSTGIRPATLVLAVIATLPATLCHMNGSLKKRDAALMLPWVLVVAEVSENAVNRALSFGFPFQDATFTRMDYVLGFDVPAIMAWCSNHEPIGRALFWCYWSGGLLLLAAILIPVIVGRKRNAEQLVLAHLLSLLIILPIVAVAPAIGPWVGYHFHGTAFQDRVEAGVTARHLASICFPSYHVIWAIFAAWSLRFIKPLRIPLAVYVTLIGISTMTTGWHYGVDVVCGIILAVVSLQAAAWLWEKLSPGEQLRQELRWAVRQ